MKKHLITEAAQCLLGICDEWDVFDIEQFLDWQLDNMDEIAEGYPIEVMTREYQRAIINEVEKLLVIKQLKSIEVDGETMQYILKETGMEWQMLRQLMLTMPLEQIEYLIEERKELTGEKLNF